MSGAPYQPGELVCVVDGRGVPVGATTIARALKSRIVTTCGRRWTLDGRHLALRWIHPRRRPNLAIRRPFVSEIHNDRH